MSTIDSIVGMKTCSKCAVKKSLDEFQKNKARHDGVETYCRECNNARLREKYAKHPFTDEMKEAIANDVRALRTPQEHTIPVRDGLEV